LSSLTFFEFFSSFFRSIPPSLLSDLLTFLSHILFFFLFQRSFLSFCYVLRVFTLFLGGVEHSIPFFFFSINRAGRTLHVLPPGFLDTFFFHYIFCAASPLIDPRIWLTHLPLPFFFTRGPSRGFFFRGWIAQQNSQLLRPSSLLPGSCALLSFRFGRYLISAPLSALSAYLKIRPQIYLSFYHPFFSF